MNLRRFTAMAVAMTIPLWCGGHETDLQGEWCTGEGERLQWVSSHTLNADEIGEVAAGEIDQTCGPIQDRSCGQLDHDDYGLSRLAAKSMCGALARPVFFGPESFLQDDVVPELGIGKHHLLYSLDQGIEFACYICVASPVREPRR